MTHDEFAALLDPKNIERAWDEAMQTLRDQGEDPEAMLRDAGSILPSTLPTARTSAADITPNVVQWIMTGDGSRTLPL